MKKHIPIPLIIHIAVAAILSFVCAAAGFGSTETAAKASVPVVKTIPLAAVPDGYEIIPASIKLGPVLRSVAFVGYSGNFSKVVRINGETSPIYYSVRPGTPEFSPDGRHCAYIAAKGKDGPTVVVVDGRPNPEVDEADHFIFSPDGSRYAYRAAKNGKQFVVIDGKAGPAYEGIVVKDNFYFSPDSRHFLYTAYKNKACVAVYDQKENQYSFDFIESVRYSWDSTHFTYKGRTEKTARSEKWCVVTDGKAGPVFDRIFDLVFSYDSKHLAYAAVKDKQMVLILDGKEIARHDLIGLPTFSFDSRTFFFAFMKDKMWHVSINGEPGPAFDKIYKFYLSPDSKKYAYIAQDGGKWTCILNGEKGSGYPKGLDVFKFSNDSSRYAYGAIMEKGGRIVCDGKPGKVYVSVGEPYFSLDVKHMVYKGRLNKKEWITVLDGKEWAKKYFAIGPYLFSPDSRHLAFRGLESLKRTVMVVDGHEECAEHNFNIMGDPFFSPDSRHLVYHVRAGEGNWRLVVDGKILPASFGGFMKGTPIIFDSPTHFHTVALDKEGKRFLGVEVDIPENMKIESEL